MAFFVFALFHWVYVRGREGFNSFFVLLFGYFLLVVNIFLNQWFFSVEWAFLGFVLVGVLFFDFGVDSRFLIFPAVLFLGFVPFLLIGGFEDVAELVAVYVYYFLVVGVVLQLVEYVRGVELRVGFDVLVNRVIFGVNWVFLIILFGLLTIGVIVGNRFFNLEFFKWFCVYLFVVVLVFHFLSWCRVSK